MHNHGLGAWMAKRRLKSPDAVALIYGDGDTVTYRELADGTDRVSALLWQRGIRKGDRVAFLGENCPEFLQVLFGAAQLGAVFVPINTRLAPPEIAHVLGDADARVLIHDADARGADRLRRRGSRARHHHGGGLGCEPRPLSAAP